MVFFQIGWAGSPDVPAPVTDEVYRLNATVEENLYTAVEDFRIDIVNGDGDGTTEFLDADNPEFSHIADVVAGSDADFLFGGDGNDTFQIIPDALPLLGNQPNTQSPSQLHRRA
mgnify:CR=1 FL=1